MRWNAHDGARAVVHEDVVRHPDGDFFSVEWIDGVAPGCNAVLLDFPDVSVFFGLALLGDKLIDLDAQIGIRRGKIVNDGVLRRELNGGCAIDRIDARSENGNCSPGWTKARVRLSVVEFEIDESTFAPPNPVALHGAHFLRPAIKFFQIAQ